MKPRRDIPSGFGADNVRPPYDGQNGRFAYEYFKEVGDFPTFDANAQDFNIVNAWWLAEASSLAYADAAFAIPEFQNAGLAAQILTTNGTECFVAENADAGIIAFRGTEIRGTDETLPGLDFFNVFTDIKTNLRAQLKTWSAGGEVHAGYQAAVDRIWNVLAPHLTRMTNDGKSIWMTGSSLGAALATIAADKFAHGDGEVAGLYTYGCPKVGDDDFEAGFNGARAFRFYNNNDIVPGFVPPLPNYVHVGNLKYIDRNGRILDDPGFAERAADQMLGLFEAFFDDNIVVPDVLADHIPIVYAAHLWNNLPGVDN